MDISLKKAMSLSLSVRLGGAGNGFLSGGVILQCTMASNGSVISNRRILTPTKSRFHTVFTDTRSKKHLNQANYMKRLLILCGIIVLLCLVAANSYSTPNAKGLKEGDIVFQTSTSRQAPFIIAATHSPWSHSGIIVEKPDGLYVLEAVSTVKLTPYDQWVKRGKGGIAKMKRYTEDPVKLKYSKYLDKSYDLSFKFGNNKWYCSELVYDIYKIQLGVELCQPRPISDYNVSGAKELMKKRGISKNQLVVAPSDLYNSKQFIN